jgi:cystathionine beta-synthase
MLQLKHKLKKGDVVVLILHDHGSRYVGKIYNDQWMAERGFFDVKTFKDVVNARGRKRLITIEPTQSVSEAVELMKKYDIEHIPVIKNNELIGAVSEGGLFQRVFHNPEIKTEKIEKVMDKLFPVVALETPIEKLGNLINKENGAVLAKDESGNYHIVTKYDVIQALA